MDNIDKNNTERPKAVSRRLFNSDFIISGLVNLGIPDYMLKRGIVGLNAFFKPIERLLGTLDAPDKGWSEHQIDFLLRILAIMETNNDPGVINIGEREGRISTPMLYDLSAGFTHGIGRSGDIKAPQPKAPGGSILNLLTDKIALNFIRKIGLQSAKGCIVLPMGTGMTLSLALSALTGLQKTREYPEERRNFGKIKVPDPLGEFSAVSESESGDVSSGCRGTVIYPRADHKSPVKGIKLAGFAVKVVETIHGRKYLDFLNKLLSNTHGNNDKYGPFGFLFTYNAVKKRIKFILTHGRDAVYTPIESIINALTPDTVAIVSTTSFFPPRAPDNIAAISRLADNFGLLHLINNAYGLQSEVYIGLIDSAVKAGRVDAVIQSTDKNFLTPVGGSIVLSPDKNKTRMISEAYPGRASAMPILHLLVSLLSLGTEGYKEMMEEREENRELLRVEMQKLAAQLGEMIPEINNPIACLMTLQNTARVLQMNGDRTITEIGGRLYNERVTGPRVVDPSVMSSGPSTADYPFPYIVMNAAIGVKRKHIEEAVKRLEKVLAEL